MKTKPIIIVAGEPYSIFSEILFKLYKSKILKNFRRPLILIGSTKVFQTQMKKLKYKIKFNEIKKKDISNLNLTNMSINIINVDLNFKNKINKISSFSSNYISKCFKIAFELIKKKKINTLINGPISKKDFLSSKFPGITEYLASKTNRRGKEVMLIYNKNLSVSTVTTHLPLKNIFKEITKSKIIKNITTVDNFYKKILNKKPKIAVCGLNPHCESGNKNNEEKKIIIPAIKSVSKKIKVSGPYATDTLFIKKNVNKFDVVLGMYHDQVLTPIKTLYQFDAINITLGLPFIRVSPDHGPNSNMYLKNKSDPSSIFCAMNFINKI